MSQILLSKSLSDYSAHWTDPHEAATSLQMREFILSHADCCERTLKKGHLTGSALVVNQTFDKVLLTHHAKLDRWLQLGGHADGDTNLLRVAITEASEESGISLREFSLCSLSQDLHNEVYAFDVDIHHIPARHQEPEHLHYDMRFLLVVDERVPIVKSNESKDLRWIPLSEALDLTAEESMQRQFRKLIQIESQRQFTLISYDHLKERGYL